MRVPISIIALVAGYTEGALESAEVPALPGGRAEAAVGTRGLRHCPSAPVKPNLSNSLYSFQFSLSKSDLFTHFDAYDRRKDEAQAHETSLGLGLAKANAK